MRRVLLTFWALVAVAILAVGGLSTLATAQTGTLTEIAVLALTLIAIAATALALRILLVLSRRRSPTRPD